MYSTQSKNAKVLENMTHKPGEKLVSRNRLKNNEDNGIGRQECETAIRKMFKYLRKICEQSEEEMEDISRTKQNIQRNENPGG